MDESHIWAISSAFGYLLIPLYIKKYPVAGVLHLDYMAVGLALNLLARKNGYVNHMPLQQSIVHLLFFLALYFLFLILSSNLTTLCAWLPVFLILWVNNLIQACHSITESWPIINLTYPICT